jgi:hypothetical protein
MARPLPDHLLGAEAAEKAADKAEKSSNVPGRCCAQQTGMHEMVMEALLVAIYSTWVTS